MSNLSSMAIAGKLLTNTPSQIVRKIELQEQVQGVIEQMSENDREVLTLRHAEGPSSSEVADILEIDPNTARQRYGRALLRLHQLLAENDISMEMN